MLNLVIPPIFYAIVAVNCQHLVPGIYCLSPVYFICHHVMTFTFPIVTKKNTPNLAFTLYTQYLWILLTCLDNSGYLVIHTTSTFFLSVDVSPPADNRGSQVG